MPDEILETSPVEINEQTEVTTNEAVEPQYVTIDALDSKFNAIQEALNKAVNGVAKKFESKLAEISKPAAVPVVEEKPVNTEPSVSLTIDALKSDYEKQIAALREESQKELDAFRQQLAEKERSEFISSVKSSVSQKFAKLGFDDVESAITVFEATHPETNFQRGSDGYVIYQKSEDDNTTLDTLVESWAKSPIGKRFKAAPAIPNGSGVKETKSKTTTTQEDLSGLSATEKYMRSLQKK
jgi:NADH dehydrogenase/NADH:ubiquinone oxidoreductase subunit G